MTNEAQIPEFGSFTRRGPGWDANGDMKAVSGSQAPLKEIISNSANSLSERLEAFDDLIDSEVGDTTLARARNIEREYGIRQLYLKFEGGNPTGTQKDRIAFAQARDALRRGYESLTVATCGNYGAAISLACSFAGLQCNIFIPGEYQTKRITDMEALGAKVIRVPGDYESAVELSREYANKEDLYDANPGGSNIALQLAAYGQIAHEIYDDLRDAPAVVAVPVSNGTTLAGIYRGFLSLYRRGKTSRLPRIIAGSSFRKNPITTAFLASSRECTNLRPEQIRETKINEPLVNWYAIDGDLALDAVWESGGSANHASDKAMLAMSRSLREKEGMHVLPAATAGLIALIHDHQRKPLINDRFVVVLTGRKA